MKKLLKKLLPSQFKQDVKDHLGVPSLSGLLKHLKQIGYTPKIVYDIGAYEGYWALDFQKVFPLAEVYMFEALQSKAGRLSGLCSQNSKFRYNIALLGADEGLHVHFHESETGSQVQRTESDRATNRITETLDSLAKKNNYPLPDFLKLDVQGYELEILKGGTDAISNAEFCLLEVSLLDIGGGGGPLLKEVVNFMSEREFCPYDISQFIRRPYDKALWQIDMLFIKKSSPFIAEKRWR